MREFKFRAWDGQTMEQVAVLNMGKLVSFIGSANDFFIAKDIMQYTGLEDKNGVEIYEGDIVSSPHFKSKAGLQYKLMHFVEWSDKYMGWYLVNTTSTDKHDGCVQMWITKDKDLEVIGNIHENNELLVDDDVQET